MRRAGVAEVGAEEITHRPSATPQILAICFGTAGIGLGMMKWVTSLPFSLQAASAALIAGGTIFE